MHLCLGTEVYTLPFSLYKCTKNRVYYKQVCLKKLEIVAGNGHLASSLKLLCILSHIPQGSLNEAGAFTYMVETADMRALLFAISREACKTSPDGKHGITPRFRFKSLGVDNSKLLLTEVGAGYKDL